MTAASTLAATRAHRAELRRDAALLQPGLWLLDGRAARHWRQAQLPAPLAQFSSNPGQRRRDPAELIRTAVRRLLSLAWVPRRPVTDPSQQAHAQAYGVRLPRTYRPESVLFDLEGRRVLRVRDGAPDPARVDVPTLLGRHVGVAPFEVLDGGRLFVEELVEGETLDSMRDPALRLEVVRSLFSSYAGIARTEGRATARPLVEEAVESASASAVPPALWTWLEANRSRLLAQSDAWPLVPSHADLTGSNILVREGAPILIDFEWAAYCPFFYDLAALLLREDADYHRHDLLRACLDGHLDDEFAALCEGASCAVEDPMTLLIATLLVRCHRSAGRPDRIAGSRYERYAARLWAPLDGVLDEGGER
jgi:hypothetical protein